MWVVVWQPTVSVTLVLLEHPQVYRASYPMTLTTTPRYKAEYGEPFAPVYGRSHNCHQYVLLPGNICSAFDNVLLPGIVCSGIYRLLPGSIQLR
ncbi:hypothetical protein DPMN_184130 [Dreissena polymorpha]|uniref:Uncharacterized protein n=1 Tax=Dreissena polymorpha TaxID=45954 RepID=A0A9D4DL67_DREPO|nr:hypothetical protein DPMN_184130 [Dreissena polymorpha]